MTAKHTPGPWRALIAPNDDLLPGESDVGVCVEHCCFDAISVVWPSKKNNHDSLAEHLANTHLIAASPDMLNALREAKAELEHFGIRTFALDVVNDAIAKAERGVATVASPFPARSCG